MAQPTRRSAVHRELSKRRYRQRAVAARHRDPHHDRRVQKRALQTNPEPDDPAVDGATAPQPATPETPETSDGD